MRKTIFVREYGPTIPISAEAAKNLAFVQSTQRWIHELLHLEFEAIAKNLDRRLSPRDPGEDPKGAGDSASANRTAAEQYPGTPTETELNAERSLG